MLEAICTRIYLIHKECQRLCSYGFPVLSLYCIKANYIKTKCNIESHMTQHFEVDILFYYYQEIINYYYALIAWQSFAEISNVKSYF